MKNYKELDESNLQYVREQFQRYIDQYNTGNIHYNKNDVDRVLNETDWVNRCYSSAGMYKSEVPRSLAIFCKWRVAMNVEGILKDENLDKHENMIKMGPNCNLIVNLSEIRTYLSYTDNYNFIDNLFIRWFENMDRSRKESLTILIYHGTDTYLETLGKKICQLVMTLNKRYFNVADYIYVPDDLLSYNDRLELIKVERSSEEPRTPIRFISPSLVDEYLRSGIISCETDDPADDNTHQK